MDRQIVYPGAIPLDKDLLYTNKNSLIGLAKLSAALMGSSTYLRGLECTPSNPASMTINLAKGEIYSLEDVDGTAYSSVDADTVNLILKQGLILSSTSYTLTAPAITGQSRNYLVQVTYADADTDARVLPYYNSGNPAVAYSGPQGNGATQNTVRAGECVVALKAGVAAVTGTQTTPSADSGYTAAWVITVPAGATSITAANIAQAASAPFIPASGIVDGVQKKLLTHGTDIGSVNAYAVHYSPAITALTDGMELSFKAANSNTSAASFSQNGAAAYPIVKLGGTVLTGGELVSGGFVTVKWNASLSSWILINTTGSGAGITNYGLGTAALRNVGTGSSQIPDMSSYLSGLNGNGAYYKFPNGSQYCRFFLKIEANSSITWTFPLAFESQPMVLTPSVINPTASMTSAMWITGIAANAVTFYNPNNTGANIDAFAIL